MFSCFFTIEGASAPNNRAHFFILSAVQQLFQMANQPITFSLSGAKFFHKAFYTNPPTLPQRRRPWMKMPISIFQLAFMYASVEFNDSEL
jgi:hypothetical protein